MQFLWETHRCLEMEKMKGFVPPSRKTLHILNEEQIKSLKCVYSSITLRSSYPFTEGQEKRPTCLTQAHGGEASLASSIWGWGSMMVLTHGLRPAEHTRHLLICSRLPPLPHSPSFTFISALLSYLCFPKSTQLFSAFVA